MRLPLLVLTGLAMASPALAAPDYLPLLTKTAEGPILGGYKEFQADTAGLEQSVTAFCAAPDTAGLDRVKTGFVTTLAGWQKVQWISYGPVEAFHRGSRMQFWPDKKNAGDRQMLALIKDRKADALEAHRIPFASVAVQGLPALEMLLFADSQADKLLSSPDETAFRCKLLAGIANNLSRVGGELVTEWEKPGGYVDIMKTIGGGPNPYADNRQAAAQLFNALHGELTAIAEVKLSYAMGANADEARPGRAESWRAKQSAANIRHNLESLRDVFATGLAPVVTAQGKPEQMDMLLKATDDALASLAQLKAPLEVEMTTADGWKRLATLKTKVKAVAQILETDIANTLELQVGFNALDGD
ncbi:MAG: imelysin family protein [Magnetospirillum gryphiswaldense]|nr:imelysin family protein [Magnetospirillum gryphiswaldense]